MVGFLGEHLGLLVLLGPLRPATLLVTTLKPSLYPFHLRARRYWYPILLDLHKFMVAISRTEVTMMVLVAFHRMLWCGIMVGLAKPELLPYVLLWTMPLFLVHLLFGLLLV